MTEPSTVQPGQERGLRRREQTIEAATAAFMKRGFAKTSLQSIVRESGGSLRDIYARFGDKEGLFRAVIIEAVSVAMDALDDIRHSADSPRPTLEQFARALLIVLMAPRTVALYRVVLGEAVHQPEIARAFRDAAPEEAVRRLSEKLHIWAEAGLISAPDPEWLARQTIEVIKGSMHNRALLDPEFRPSSADIEKQASSAINLIWNGMAPK